MTALTESCPSGRPWYPGKGVARKAAWAHIQRLGPDGEGLTPIAFLCRDGCGGSHYDLLTRDQVAAKLIAEGKPVTEEALTPAARSRKVTPEYEACPGCGAGWGVPHFERCGMDEIVYDRELMPSDVTVITMFTISLFPLDVMRRATIRAMMPRGTRISMWFGRSLKWAEDYGYIERGPDWIRVRSRQPMVAFAGRRLRDDQALVEQIWLAIAKVAAGLPPEITAEGKAVRARELAALRHLMESAPPGPRPGLRIVPRPGRQP